MKVSLGVLSLFLFAACAEPIIKDDLIVELNGEAPEFLIIKNSTESDTLSSSATAQYRFDNEANDNYVTILSPGVRRMLYLEEGKTVNAVLSPTNVEAPLTFTGELKNENETLSELNKLDKEYNATLREALMKDWAGFEEGHKAYLTNRAAAINALPVSETFASLETKRNELLMQSGGFLFNNYHAQLSGDTAPTPQACIDLIETVNIEDESMLNIPEYMDLVDQRIGYNLGNVEFETSADVVKAKLSLSDKIKSEKIKMALQRSVLESHIQYSGVDDIADNLSVFYANADAKSKASVEALALPWMKIASGNQAPELTLKDAEGNVKLLSEFKGKAVYIDFWATWCQPCLAEMPALFALGDALEGEEIELLSISVDKNLEAWETFLKENNPDGVQLHQGESAGLVKSEYLVYSIPRFVLIDKDGNIVNANAPRPSGGALEYIRTKVLADA